MNEDDATRSLLPSKETSSSSSVNRRRVSNRERSTSPCHPFIRINSPKLNNIISNNHDDQNHHPQFTQVIAFLFLYLALGTLFFFLVRHQINGTKTNGFVDALYFCVVTMTTVGYGDLVPDTVLAKLLSCLFVFSGMTLVGFFLSNAADYILDKQKILMVKALHMRQHVSPTHILRELQTNKAMYKCLFAFSLLFLLITVGTVFLTQVESMKLVDAFYCVCVTITTLGYGDRSFSTEAGRVFAVFWIVSSTICLAQFLLYVAELYTERRQRSIVEWVLRKRMTYSDLENADLDHDKSVSAAEFIIFKLKEMEKIHEEEDIRPLMEIFHKLDADHSGALTASDLMLSQAP